MPHERSIQDGHRAICEERRLAYVGVTRSKDFLTLSWAKHRTKWGKRRKTKTSRFLAEMNGEPVGFDEEAVRHYGHWAELEAAARGPQ